MVNFTINLGDNVLMNFIKTSSAVAVGILAATAIGTAFQWIANKASRQAPAPVPNEKKQTQKAK